MDGKGKKVAFTTGQQSKTAIKIHFRKHNLKLLESKSRDQTTESASLKCCLWKTALKLSPKITVLSWETKSSIEN